MPNNKSQIDFSIKICFVVVAFAFFSACKTAIHTKYGHLSQGKAGAQSDFMYQYSIIDALMAGVFDGNMTIGELKTKGNFGIGTFNRADGELYMNEGLLYRIKYDGSVALVNDADSTSLAFTKFFEADTTIVLSGIQLTYDDVQQQLGKLLNPNYIYAIRMTATFSTMTARAPAAAKQPYPTLPAHLKTSQYLFNFTNTTGICAGFIMPPYMARTNVPGFHCHYLAADKKSGGHVFGFTTNTITVEVDRASGFTVENNTNHEFKQIDLQPDRAKELKKIE